MPEITFMHMSGNPDLALVEGDYFYHNGPPDLPEIPSPSGLFERAQNLVDKFARGVGDIGKVPTNLDINGANVGMALAKRVAVMNRLQEEDYTFYEICLIIMDGSPKDGIEGFMDSYNLLVRQYAEAMYLHAEVIFSNSPQDKLSFLNKQFMNAKGLANGLVRATNAALLAAYAVAISKEELPLGPLATIKRGGKIPAGRLYLAFPSARCGKLSLRADHGEYDMRMNCAVQKLHRCALPKSVR